MFPASDEVSSTRDLGFDFFFFRRFFRGSKLLVCSVEWSVKFAGIVGSAEEFSVRSCAEAAALSWGEGDDDRWGPEDVGPSCDEVLPMITCDAMEW